MNLPKREGLITHTSPIGKKDFNTINCDNINNVNKYDEHKQLRHSQAFGGGRGGGGLLVTIQFFKLI